MGLVGGCQHHSLPQGPPDEAGARGGAATRDIATACPQEVPHRELRVAWGPAGGPAAHGPVLLCPPPPQGLALKAPLRFCRHGAGAALWDSLEENGAKVP